MYLIIRAYWDKHPLRFLLIAGFWVRLISVVFSKGYGMFDDHFWVVEPAQSWLDGFDSTKWLPKSTDHPNGHGWFFPGFHYVLLAILKFFSIKDPQIKMYFIRLILAGYSLFSIYFAFTITQKISNSEKNARLVGLLMAFLFFFPIFSVRSLVEMATIPLVLYSFYLFIFYQSTFWLSIFSGIISGLAICVRFQSVFFPIGLGLVFLFQKKWLPFTGYFIGNVIGLSLIHGIVDFYFWGYPYAELIAYVQFNWRHSLDFIVHPWYQYLMVLAGFLVPPVSIFLLVGFWKTRKSQLMLFLPAFLFLIFHSYFPNKQERFILPVIPFVIILGVIGWNDMFTQKQVPTWIQKHHSKFWAFFWALNTAALFAISPAYMKKTRVEAMYYLYRQEGNKRFITEVSFEETGALMPMFYLGEWYDYGDLTSITKNTNVDELCAFFQKNPEKSPQYVIFLDENDLESRVSKFKTCFPDIELVKVIEASYLDRLVHWLNPINKNYTAFIYQIR